LSSRCSAPSPHWFPSGGSSFPGVRTCRPARAGLLRVFRRRGLRWRDGRLGKRDTGSGRKVPTRQCNDESHIYPFVPFVRKRCRRPTSHRSAPSAGVDARRPLDALAWFARRSTSLRRQIATRLSSGRPASRWAMPASCPTPYWTRRPDRPTALACTSQMTFALHTTVDQAAALPHTTVLRPCCPARPSGSR
jgi:hypothetical protein